jgi:hypothetical protein
LPGIEKSNKNSDYSDEFENDDNIETKNMKIAESGNDISSQLYQTYKIKKNNALNDIAEEYEAPVEDDDDDAQLIEEEAEYNKNNIGGKIHLYSTDIKSKKNLSKRKG